MLSGMVTVLTGCDSAYRLVVENHTDQQLVVSTPWGKYPFRPCSVRRLAGMGPPYGKPVRIEAKDSEGRTVYRTEVRSERDRPDIDFHVVIPGQQGVVCPTPAATFMFHVWNHSTSQLELLLDGERIGSMPGRCDRLFGPLPGTWGDAERIVIRGDEGQESLAKNCGLDFDYLLGEVPEGSIAVSESFTPGYYATVAASATLTPSAARRTPR